MKKILFSVTCCLALTGLFSGCSKDGDDLMDNNSTTQSTTSAGTTANDTSATDTSGMGTDNDDNFGSDLEDAADDLRDGVSDAADDIID